MGEWGSVEDPQHGMERMQDKMREAIRAEAAWLEDVLAGLLINGVHNDEIEVRRFQSDPLRVEVWVRGEAKYRHNIRFTVR